MSPLALSRRFKRTERKVRFAGDAESAGGVVSIAVSEPVTDDLVYATGKRRWPRDGEERVERGPATSCPPPLSPISVNANLRPWSRSWCTSAPDSRLSLPPGHDSLHGNSSGGTRHPPPGPRLPRPGDASSFQSLVCRVPLGMNSSCPHASARVARAQSRSQTHPAPTLPAGSSVAIPRGSDTANGSAKAASTACSTADPRLHEPAYISATRALRDGLRRRRCAAAPKRARDRRAGGRPLEQQVGAHRLTQAALAHGGRSDLRGARGCMRVYGQRPRLDRFAGGCGVQREAVRACSTSSSAACCTCASNVAGAPGRANPASAGRTSQSKRAPCAPWPASRSSPPGIAPATSDHPEPRTEGCFGRAAALEERTADDAVGFGIRRSSGSSTPSRQGLRRTTLRGSPRLRST